VILKIYDLRREPVMRAARKFVVSEFWPQNYDEFKAVVTGYGTEPNAWFRQVLTYWNMVAALVLRGAVEADQRPAGTAGSATRAGRSGGQSREVVMFELDQFVSDCRAALGENAPQRAVHEVVRRAVSAPGEILKTIGEPQRAEMQTLYRSDDLTILNVIWAPWMNLLPHNHQMWAIIGLYTGREDNIFWRRVPGSNGLVEAAGARALREKDAEPLGRDIIHSVSNPIPKLTGALHVYGGDFFGVPRSEWDAETLLEQQCSGEKMARRFEEANALLK
jgi:predicted metal-dependent enzyme (double-stranded beta helix superfamily)